MRTLRILALAAFVAQIAGPAEAALAIFSDQAAYAAAEAKKACALAAQTAATVMIDPVTLANLERVKALCDAAAGKPLTRREWPEEIDPQAREVFDANNLAEGMKALIVCGKLAKLRASSGKASASAEEIDRIATATKPRGGMAVFDVTATVGFATAANDCNKAVARHQAGN
jgi:hypothetical protein